MKAAAISRGFVRCRAISCCETGGLGKQRFDVDAECDGAGVASSVWCVAGEGTVADLEAEEMIRPLRELLSCLGSSTRRERD